MQLKWNGFRAKRYSIDGPSAEMLRLMLRPVTDSSDEGAGHVNNEVLWEWRDNTNEDWRTAAVLYRSVRQLIGTRNLIRKKLQTLLSQAEWSLNRSSTCHQFWLLFVTRNLIGEDFSWKFQHLSLTCQLTLICVIMSYEFDHWKNLKIQL